MSSKTTYETLQAFLATLYVATEVHAPFVWDAERTKRVIVDLMRKDHMIRTLGIPLMSRHSRLPGAPETKNGNQPAYYELFDWFRRECVDTVDPLRTTVRLNDNCLRFAHTGRALLEPEIHAAIKAHAKNFFRATQLST